MDKIKVIPYAVDHKGRDISEINDPVVITEEEIEEVANKCLGPLENRGFIQCWEYIKSRINQ